MAKHVLKIQLETRLDQALLDHLRTRHPATSRAQLKKWLAEERVRLNGRPAKGNQRLSAGQYEVDLDVELRLKPAGENFLPIVFENDDLLALNKAPGIHSAPQRPEDERTAVQSALAYFPHLPAGRTPLEPGLLHRLDQATSGVLLFAKTESAFATLRDQWPDVKKIYRAICREPDGGFAPKTLITLPLGRVSTKKMIAVKKDKDFSGKLQQARTELLAINELTDDLLDLTVQLHTGVMHQIRCHLAAIGLPILGDTLYGGEKSDRLWLHAWKLRALGQNIEATLPDNWGNF